MYDFQSKFVGAVCKSKQMVHAIVHNKLQQLERQLCSENLSYRWAYRWPFQFLIISIIYVQARNAKMPHAPFLTKHKSLLFTQPMLHGPVNFLIKASKMLMFYASGMENNV